MPPPISQLRKIEERCPGKLPPKCEYEIYVNTVLRAFDANGKPNPMTAKSVTMNLRAQRVAPSNDVDLSQVVSETKLAKTVHRFNTVSTDLMLINTSDPKTVGALLDHEAKSTYFTVSDQSFENPLLDGVDFWGPILTREPVRYFVIHLDAYMQILKCAADPSLKYVYDQHMSRDTKMIRHWKSLTPREHEFLSSDQAGYAQMAYKSSKARLVHHESKAAMRMRLHFQGLSVAIAKASGGNAEEQRATTEARGEFLAAQFMQMVLFESQGDGVFEMKRGFSPGGKRAGIDQVWVKRNTQGDVTAYYLVESKGGTTGHLGSTESYGEQMSLQWVMHHLTDMYEEKGEKYVGDKNLGKKILDAILNPAGLPVCGIMVQAKFNPGNERGEGIVVRDWGKYNFDPKAMQTQKSPKEFNVTPDNSDDEDNMKTT